MKCYEELMEIFDLINKSKKGYSYSVLDQYKEDGILDNLMQRYNIENLFEKEVVWFLKILINEDINKFPFNRKLYLYESEYLKLFKTFGYELSLFLNNKDAYRHLTKFVKACIDKYNIETFKGLSEYQIELLLNKHIDMSKCYNPNLGKEIVEVVPRIPNNYTNYAVYEEKIKNNTLKFNDKTDFFVWSEYTTYISEYNELTKHYQNVSEYVKWVSRYNGDGYGFDILSYDPISMHEKLIEVKSSHYNYFEITLNEYKTLYKTKDLEYCDYYIYFYCIIDNILKVSKLKYDKQNNVFVDINNNDIYNIELDMTPNKDYPNSYNNKITAVLVKQEPLNKVLTK